MYQKHLLIPPPLSRRFYNRQHPRRTGVFLYIYAQHYNKKRRFFPKLKQNSPEKNAAVAAEIPAFAGMEDGGGNGDEVDGGGGGNGEWRAERVRQRGGACYNGGFDFGKIETTSFCNAMLKFFASSRPRSSGGGDSAGAAAGALPPLRAAIVGAGTVGGGVLKLLRQNADIIAARCGRRIEPCAIVARDLKKARGRLHSENAAMLGSDWQQAAAHPKADVVVELMGGENEAGECILLALQNGKAVVTANKALLAAKGDDIFAAARQADKPVAFEAAIAGCIPIIKTLREALAADDVGEAAGIINGTCNHILTAMSGRGLSFESALAESQRLGYAEADPSLDIDGIDAAHKIALIARLAFNARPKMGDFPIKGVRDFDLRDIRHAAGMGFCIKLLAQARREKKRRAFVGGADSGFRIASAGGGERRNERHCIALGLCRRNDVLRRGRGRRRDGGGGGRRLD